MSGMNLEDLARMASQQQVPMSDELRRAEVEAVLTFAERVWDCGLDTKQGSEVDRDGQAVRGIIAAIRSYVTACESTDHTSSLVAAAVQECSGHVITLVQSLTDIAIVRCYALGIDAGEVRQQVDAEIVAPARQRMEAERLAALQSQTPDLLH